MERRESGQPPSAREPKDRFWAVIDSAVTHAIIGPLYVAGLMTRSAETMKALRTQGPGKVIGHYAVFYRNVRSDLFPGLH